MEKNNQRKVSLIKSRRFLPLFITQFLGAFNDNAFKNAFLIWFTYHIIEYHGLDSAFIVSLGTGLFILPFFLFSATAGQLADKFEKAGLTKKIKLIEIILMVLCAICFYNQYVVGLLIILFAMGAQSTFFGPIKYSLLPELLEREELICANSYIEAGTFLSILLGTIFGGLIILSDFGVEIISFFLIIFAILGYISSLYIPQSKIADSSIEMSYDIYKETKEIIDFAKNKKIVWHSILAISWFWFIGVIFLSQFPIYTKEIIHGNEEVVTLFLAIFSIGIGIGSALCNILVKGKLKRNIVTIAGIGISFGMLLFILTSYGYNFVYTVQNQEYLNCYTAIDLSTLLINNNSKLLDICLFMHKGIFSYGIIFSLLFISIMAGIFIVPLYALIQEKGERAQMSRVIAANNVINAIFMVLASLFALCMYAIGFEILYVFICVAIFNVIACILFFKLKQF